LPERACKFWAPLKIVFLPAGSVAVVLESHVLSCTLRFSTTAPGVVLDFIPDEILPPPSLGSYLLVSPPWMAVMSELQEHIQTMQSSVHPRLANDQKS
jgi:hypothetical protein